MAHCPACKTEGVEGLAKCPGCGVTFSRWTQRQDGPEPVFEMTTPIQRSKWAAKWVVVYILVQAALTVLVLALWEKLIH